MHQLQTVSKQQQSYDDASSLSIPRKSVVELQQTKQRPKSTVPTTSKTQSLPKTMVVRNAEPPIKPKTTSNGRRTPTTVVGVNGIKNNNDASRKFASLPITKRPASMNELSRTVETVPITTMIEQSTVESQRIDSEIEGIDENINRLEQKINQHSSP